VKYMRIKEVQYL